MVEPPHKSLSVPTPDQRRTAAEQYQRANQWLVAARPDKALPLLLDCCRIDPANLIYLQTFHAAARQNTPRGGVLAKLRLWIIKRRLQKAMAARDWRLVIEIAQILQSLDPNNTVAEQSFATAYEALALFEHAVWCMEQAQLASRSFTPVNTELVRLYEKVGKFTQAMGLANPPSTPAEDAKAQSLKEQVVATPSDSDLYVQLAHHYREAGDWLAAREWLSRGLTATANDFNLMVEQARLDMDLLKQDVCIGEQKLAANPGNRELDDVLSRIKHEIQAREIDIARWRAERYPHDLQLQLDLGVLLLKAGQFDSALEAFSAARIDNRLTWRALVYAGYCHLNNGQPRKAAPLFEEALPLIPPESGATRQELLAHLAAWKTV